MSRTKPWGDYSRLLAGLPYDVQAQLYSHLEHRKDLDPGTLYRLPMLHSTARLQLLPGAQAIGVWRFLTLTATYGISVDFDNETGGSVAGATLVYPSEVNLSIDFNQGQTQWIGSNAEPCSLGALGDPSVSGPTRMDPIVAIRQDTWNLTLNADVALANAVFCRVNLHGVKIYSATGAI